MKYIISTLGCKVNQYETQAIEVELKKKGHTPAASGKNADLVIVNTCAVTAESGRKSRQIIRRLAEENPGALIAVCGCYSQISSDDLEELGVNVVFGTNDKLKFIDTIEKSAAENENFRLVDDPFKRHEFEKLPAGAVSGRTRAMLKIQDGCVNFCSYCIIPYTRGRLRSLPVPDAVEEIRRIRDEGYKEVVFTGIEIASYGVDLPGKPGLADLICECSKEAGEMRIRLGSLEPTVITEDFCRRLSECPNICRHFHLSLQSGCSKTLKDMKRKYDTEHFYEACTLLRNYFPGVALTCDLITGFPGETEEDFDSTLAFIRKCAFSNMHIFPYSRRPGTAADKMPYQVTRNIKAERSAKAQKICNEMRMEYLQANVGKTLPVLFETEENGFSTGHSDTYCLVSVSGTMLRNSVQNVKILYVRDDKLIGVIIN